jgi:hypothetical protein
MGKAQISDHKQQGGPPEISSEVRMVLAVCQAAVKPW